MQRYSTEFGYERYIQINNQTVLINKTVQNKIQTNDSKSMCMQNYTRNDKAVDIIVESLPLTLAKHVGTNMS